jgi:hypothetical protein
MRIAGIIMTVFSIALIACKSQHHNFDGYEGKIITIGKGGGFTGAYDEYSILENGRVFKYNTIEKERHYLGKIESNVTRQLFSNYAMLGISGKELNNPGNMNYYIQYKDDQNSFRSLWSDFNAVDKNIRLFYDFAMNSVSRLRDKN